MMGIGRSYNRSLNKFLNGTVQEIKKRFHGRITYASGPWEKINWQLFDMIGADLYRSSYNKTVYQKELQEYQRMGKPVCIMEFGCCTFKGADEKGAMGWTIVDWKKTKPALKGHFVRDEKTQSNYLLDLLRLFDQEKLFGAFVFTFILENYVHDDDPTHDLDMASYGIVKPLANHKKAYRDLPWGTQTVVFRAGQILFISLK